MKFDRFEDIIAWQKSKKLTIAIYCAFTDCKDYDFKNQIKRASVSIMNNIAEGFERQTNNEFRHFAFVAKGSCGEVRSMLYLAKELKILKQDEIERLILQSEEWINIFSQGTPDEKTRVVRILKEIDPANITKYDRINR